MSLPFIPASVLAPPCHNPTAANGDRRGAHWTASVKPAPRLGMIGALPGLPITRRQKAGKPERMGPERMGKVAQLSKVSGNPKQA
jgi:hypothetical protein